MPILHLNLTAIVALWMGGALLLVPLLALALRFGVVPVLDAVARMRSPVSAAPAEERTADLEMQVTRLTAVLNGLLDEIGRRAA